MSRPQNDKLNDIIRDHIEAVTSLTPEQLDAYNEVCNILFNEYFNHTNKLQQKEEN